MATKNNFVGIDFTRNADIASGKNKFTNFNLNQNFKNFNLEVVKGRSKSIGHKGCSQDFETSTEHYRPGGSSKLSQPAHLYSKSYTTSEATSKKVNSSSNIKRSSSILSLHITAYENSIEYGNSHVEQPKCPRDVPRQQQLIIQPNIMNFQLSKIPFEMKSDKRMLNNLRARDNLSNFSHFLINGPQHDTDKTEMICTINPDSQSVRQTLMLIKMIALGMKIVRIRLSNGNYQDYAKSMANARLAATTVGANFVRFAVEVKGPEISTGLFAEGKEVELHQNNSIRLTTDPNLKNSCTTSNLYVDYKNITKVVSKGSRVFIDDGLISLIVNEVHTDGIICTIEKGGILGSAKSVNLPYIPADFPVMSQKVINDLQFAIEQQVDILFASFIRNADGIQTIRKILGEKGKNIQIIAKVENQEGVDNADEIIAESDGVMVHLGEFLGDEINDAQRTLITKCSSAGKVIVCSNKKGSTTTCSNATTAKEAKVTSGSNTCKPMQTSKKPVKDTKKEDSSSDDEWLPHKKDCNDEPVKQKKKKTVKEGKDKEKKKGEEEGGKDKEKKKDEKEGGKDKEKKKDEKEGGKDKEKKKGEEEAATDKEKKKGEKEGGKDKEKKKGEKEAATDKEKKKREKEAATDKEKKKGEKEGGKDKEKKKRSKREQASAKEAEKSAVSVNSTPPSTDITTSSDEESDKTQGSDNGMPKATKDSSQEPRNVTEKEVIVAKRKKRRGRRRSPSTNTLSDVSSIPDDNTKSEILNTSGSKATDTLREFIMREKEEILYAEDYSKVLDIICDEHTRIFNVLTNALNFMRRRNQIYTYLKYYETIIDSKMGHGEYLHRLKKKFQSLILSTEPQMPMLKPGTIEEVTISLDEFTDLLERILNDTQRNLKLLNPGMDELFYTKPLNFVGITFSDLVLPSDFDDNELFVLRSNKHLSTNLEVYQKILKNVLNAVIFINRNRELIGRKLLKAETTMLGEDKEYLEKLIFKLKLILMVNEAELSYTFNEDDEELNSDEMIAVSRKLDTLIENSRKIRMFFEEITVEERTMKLLGAAAAKFKLIESREFVRDDEEDEEQQVFM